MKKKRFKVDRNTLFDLYVTKRKTTYEIAEIFGVYRSTISDHLKKHGIAVNPKQRKFEIIKKVPFTKEQKEMIIGTMLGDGCIATHGTKTKSYSLYIGHCEKQKDLVMWKKGVLGNFVNVIHRRVDKRGNSIMWCFTTITHHELKQI